MDLLSPECAATSVGPANQLFGLLIQTILAAQCAISPKEMWPKDYGPTALEKGIPFIYLSRVVYKSKKTNFMTLMVVEVIKIVMTHRNTIKYF